MQYLRSMSDHVDGPTRNPVRFAFVSRQLDDAQKNQTWPGLAHGLGDVGFYLLDELAKATGRSRGELLDQVVADLT